MLALLLPCIRLEQLQRIVGLDCRPFHMFRTDGVAVYLHKCISSGGTLGASSAGQPRVPSTELVSPFEVSYLEKLSKIALDTFNLVSPAPFQASFYTEKADFALLLLSSLGCVSKAMRTMSRAQQHPLGVKA